MRVRTVCEIKLRMRKNVYITIASMEKRIARGKSKLELLIRCEGNQLKQKHIPRGKHKQPCY